MTLPFDPNTAFVFANAFELVISLFVAAMLLCFTLGKIEGWCDFWRRAWRTLHRDFQGGPYDLAVAMMTIFAGKVIRTEAAWEWRFFQYDLSVNRLMLGVFISAVGALCLIRVLAPTRWFNFYWVSAGLLATAFATYSALS